MRLCPGVTENQQLPGPLRMVRVSESGPGTWVFRKLPKCLGVQEQQGGHRPSAVTLQRPGMGSSPVGTAPGLRLVSQEVSGQPGLGKAWPGEASQEPGSLPPVPGWAPAERWAQHSLCTCSRTFQSAREGLGLTYAELQT